MTRPAGRPGRPLLLTAALAVTALLASACGGEPDESAAVDASDWDAVLAEAQGQSVDWYMYGGDQRLNDFVNGEVADRLAELGVSLNQVKITDTAEAVNKVLGEQQAGRTSGGSVDAIWVNGENFATGVQADLWACGWTADLPNAKHVDLDDPAVATDFGVPVEGCEAAWQQASSALVYDSAALDEADVESVESLLAWTASEPGRFTHPTSPARWRWAPSSTTPSAPRPSRRRPRAAASTTTSTSRPATRPSTGCSTPPTASGAAARPTR